MAEICFSSFIWESSLLLLRILDYNIVARFQKIYWNEHLTATDIRRFKIIELSNSIGCLRSAVTTINPLLIPKSRCLLPIIPVPLIRCFTISNRYGGKAFTFRLFWQGKLKPTHIQPKMTRNAGCSASKAIVWNCTNNYRKLQHQLFRTWNVYINL